MPSLPPRTTIVTVAYNSTEVLPAMLASVPAGVPVVLVDNGSADLAELRALAVRTGARLVENGRNLGFGPACNVGAALADTEFILFLNPDTILTPEAIARLEAAMDRHPAASAANPRLTDGAGRPYFKRRSVLLPRSEWLARGWPDADRQVPVLSGAALFCGELLVGVFQQFPTAFNARRELFVEPVVTLLEHVLPTELEAVRAAGRDYLARRRDWASRGRYSK